LRRRFIGAALFPTCAFPPVLRRPNSLPHWGLASRPLAAAAGHAIHTPLEEALFSMDATELGLARVLKY
jgi:hypothetical protein